MGSASVGLLDGTMRVRHHPNRQTLRDKIADHSPAGIGLAGARWVIPDIVNLRLDVTRSHLSPPVDAMQRVA